MAISVFDLFKVGIGPSSSHTVGPMRAARLFALRLQAGHFLTPCITLHIDLYGSLGATGHGHGSDKAVMLGLMGLEPDTVDVAAIGDHLDAITTSGILSVLGLCPVDFDAARDLQFRSHESLPFHPNALRLSARDEGGLVVLQCTYYSVGGGFVVSQEVADDSAKQALIAPPPDILPLPFHSGADLLTLSAQHGISMSEIMRRNERHWRSDTEIDSGLMHLWQTMQACVKRGCEQTGELPGGFHVKRRAPGLHQRLQSGASQADPLHVMDWVNLYALSVNEENAAGGRVVTAPTNGAAGIIPAVLHYYWRFVPGATEQGVADFLLTAGAIGLLYKENASISGAEVGCQGEVGVACSMAAAGLCAVLGGSTEQIENAAEIGMEHHLGLTCDPVGGLVQIPCIERNAIAAVKAINAARLALHGDGSHRVSLDKVIQTMRETGADMKSKYKETALGGLAVNIVAC
ncbi:MAG: L-serine ammonia-lyase [Aquabacterium sp.]|nr:L-serine ammonia-lyase [Aquabacterium sp.]